MSGKTMKKHLAFLLALVLALAAAANGAAEGRLELMADAVEELLCETGNVTLNGHAEFSLDGEWFKTADGKYIQDGYNSSWQWLLQTPRRDGSVREGGYTVIANGEKVYVMESFYPGVYKTGTTFRSATILRQSVQLTLMLRLFRQLAEQAETLLGEQAVTVVSDGPEGLAIRLQADESAPEAVQTALNLAAQFAAKRYFGTDYDRLSPQYMLPMASYLTVTQAILGTTCELGLRAADVTLKRDAGGRLEQITGKAELELDTNLDGAHRLSIEFRLDVSDWESSHVGTFSPEKYGVTLAEGYAPLDFPDSP